MTDNEKYGENYDENYGETYGLYVRETEKAIKKIFLSYDQPLKEMFEYATLSGGKRLRPCLFLSALSGYGKKMTGDDYMFAAAIELIHSYSLVHDDLPEMDNDEYRRGRLTVHAKYGHALALLCGDGLLNAAYEVLSYLGTVNKRYARAMYHLSLAAGSMGMIAGQTMEFTADKLSKEKIIEIESLKTSKLIEGAMVSACIIADHEEDMEYIKEFSGYFGISFQLKDDLMDIKPDEKNIRFYVNDNECIGLLNDYTDKYIKALDKLGMDSTFIKAFCKKLLERDGD